MRYPVEYIVVYRDTCLRSFGTSCPAVLGGDVTDKCFNTINTCPVKNSYNRGTHRDVFYNPDNFTSTIVTPAVLGQDFEAAYPFLHKTSHKPATINPAGVDSGSGPLGTRATLNITLMDGRSNDRLQDKYFTHRISGAAQLDGVGYQPDERSTFLIKYLARNPYLYARRVDWVTGYIKDGEVVGKKTRTFVIKNVGNVDERGTLNIECQDPLFLTNIKHAKAPRESSNELLTDMPASVAGQLPVGELGSIYGFPAITPFINNYFNIDGEIIHVVRQPEGDTVTRGVLGTAVADLSEGATIQRVLVFTNDSALRIIEVLLNEYTNISDVGDFLDFAQWSQVVSQYDWLQHNYTGYIPEPTSVAELLEDIAEQMYFYPYWNEEAAKIHLAANVPAPPVAELQFSRLIDEHSNIIADSLRIKPQHNRVFTRVSVHHGVRNWVEDLDDTKNYKSVQSFINLEQEDGNHRRSVTSKDVYGYFLDGTLAVELGENIHELCKNPPLELQFSLDAKDSDLKLAQFFRLKTRLVTNTMGEEMELAAQVTSVREAVTGSKWDYKAVALNFGVGTHARPNVWPILIAEDMTNVNVKNIFDATYPTYTPSSGDRIIVTVASGVTLNCSSAGSAALHWNIPEYSGVTTELVIQSGVEILGAGGDAGEFPPPSDVVQGIDGQDGGHALLATTKIHQVVMNGYAGGGGGGGASVFGSSAWGGGGGGGAGTPPGKGATGGDFNGHDGTATTGGMAGGTTVTGAGPDRTYLGGAGGNRGADGGRSRYIYGSTEYWMAQGGKGGAAFKNDSGQTIPRSGGGTWDGDWEVFG